MSVFSEVLQRCCVLLRLHSVAERRVSVSIGGVTLRREQKERESNPITGLDRP
jgi:hypothetical protein